MSRDAVLIMDHNSFVETLQEISSIELRYSAKCVCGREREGGIQRDRERERQERDRDKKTVNAERRVQNNK